MSDFKISEFAETLGVTQPTIWKYITQGEIDAYRIGRSVRIPQSEYERFINSHRILNKEVQ
ncbi:MAG: helix-turn-helix domain-containing protein [Oceanospirillaceae bacterium]|nr:helix-turn-helix domain-containing protein [Oceanospirillaceae bacterium]